MKLEIISEAKKEINSDFTSNEQILIIEKLDYFAKNYDELIKTKNVKKLANSNVSRYKISGDIRAIFITFFIKNDGTIIILSVAKRKESYESKNIKNYEKRAKDYKKSKE